MVADGRSSTHCCLPHVDGRNAVFGHDRTQVEVDPSQNAFGDSPMGRGPIACSLWQVAPLVFKKRLARRSCAALSLSTGLAVAPAVLTMNLLREPCFQCRESPTGAAGPQSMCDGCPHKFTIRRADCR